MNLLVIGGTRFMGRHLVETALARGHQVTLFHRGQTNPQLFPQAQHITGDRDGGLSALPAQTWDTVIDMCGYVPRVLRQAVDTLRDRVSNYVFISSVSVYRSDMPLHTDENGPLCTIADETREDITEDTYGALKVLCEQVVQAAYADRALIIRPGLIVGPNDYTDRFVYWPYRVARGGEVLAPGNPDQPVQVIDARDLGEWIVRLVEARRGGVFNAVGPDYALTTRQMLDTCCRVCNPQAQLTWVAEDFLLAQHVTPWSDLPVWVPAADAAFDTVSNRRALEAGLTFRALEDTVADTLAWAAARPADHAWRAGLSPEREAAVLRAWHARTS